METNCVAEVVVARASCLCESRRLETCATAPARPGAEGRGDGEHPAAHSGDAPRFHGCGVFRLVLLFLMLFAGLAPASLQAQYRVLFIGNSFTIGSGGGGVPGIFDRLAQAGGHPDPDTVMRAVGGEDFQFHSADATTQVAIRSQAWTHVVLQNYSTQPTHLASGSVPNHYAYGSLLYRQVMTNNPATRVVLFETWSRSAAHSLITGVSSPTSFASTAEFQTELRTNYQGLAEVKREMI